MKRGLGFFLGACLLVASPMALSQSVKMRIPRYISAGEAFSILTTGTGSAEIYIVGPEQTLLRRVRLGDPVHFPAGVVYDAGYYLVALVHGASTDTGTLKVVPENQPDKLAFLAEPSRIPVDLPDGISGTAYIFDVYHNLIVQPMPMSFEISNGLKKDRTQVVVTSRNGVAWTRMNSAARAGDAIFMASTKGVSSKRVIDQVPGEPCSLSMTANPSGRMLMLRTAPVFDCSGNPVPDGTIVTFTERLNGKKCTVDVPLKKGIASAQIPAWAGATISVASGEMAGNEIRWTGRE